jgi:signal transduction histidine kinase
VQLEVIDRGVGIEPAIAQTMFDPFETTKPDGMGMGLAVCRTILESHGGRVGRSRSTPAARASRSNFRGCPHEHGFRARAARAPGRQRSARVEVGRTPARERGHRHARQHLDRRIPRVLRRDHPRCLVLDLSMPGTRAWTCNARCTIAISTCPIVFLSVARTCLRPCAR